MDMSLHSFPFKTIKSISLESTLPIEQLSLDLISSAVSYTHLTLPTIYSV